MLTNLINKWQLSFWYSYSLSLVMHGISVSLLTIATSLNAIVCLKRLNNKVRKLSYILERNLTYDGLEILAKAIAETTPNVTKPDHA